MSQLKLRPMTESEQVAYSRQMREGYVRQRMEFGGESQGVAEAHAETAMGQLWPGGRLAEGNHLFAGVVDGEVVGQLWLAKQAPNGSADQAWIHDVVVDPTHRGRGFGRALVAAAEDVAREFGRTSLGLNVFGGNEIAIGLYESMGFRTASMLMRKAL